MPSWSHCLTGCLLHPLHCLSWRDGVSSSMGFNQDGQRSKGPVKKGNADHTTGDERTCGIG